MIAHPECTRGVLELAHHIRSISGMLQAAADSAAREFVLATGAGMVHPLSEAAPGKRFCPPAREPLCPNMKLTALSRVLWSLEALTPEAKVPEGIRARALLAVERMLAVTV